MILNITFQCRRHQMVRSEPAGNVPWKGGGSVVVIICPKETINTNGQQAICIPNSWPETRDTGRIGKYDRNRFQREEFPVPGESRRQTSSEEHTYELQSLLRNQYAVLRFLYV